MLRDLQIEAALNGPSSNKNQFNIISNSKPSGGMTIRGLAGPSAVVAQNFAPGTTAADIESAMLPIGGTVLSCRITTSRPTVMAEIIFESRDGAENVIATFNNQTVCTTVNVRPNCILTSRDRRMVVSYTSI
jgi:hypothetical protein